jgi:hypothetical protein
MTNDKGDKVKQTARTIRAATVRERSFYRSLTVAARIGAALSLCLLISLSFCVGEEGEGVPLFRRLLLLPERLPEELKRVQDGVLVRLPVAEFDALGERAAQAGKRRPPPQLLEARYHATLKEESLIGEGQWKLIHTEPGPELLKLQPFNLALRQARFENGDALIAAFDGKTPALFVDAPGERTVSLDWSARAESSPEGLQFHLEMPPCPVALLELDVPAGRTVTVLNDSALLSGPYEAENNDLRRWKIVCGGRQRLDRQRVDIRIHPVERPATSSDPQPAPFVHQKTTQKLNPDGLDATFELTLDGLPGGIRELVCECDAALRLRDVVGPGVDDCSFQAGDANKPSRLTIRLREPVRAGTWKILCLAPLNGGTGASPVPPPDSPRSIAWRSPGLHLVNGVPRGETLALWLHPDLRVESWDRGSYRLTSSDLDRVTGSQVLTLLGGGLGPLRRPAARLQAYAVEFSTQQLTWWRCNAGGMSLTVQIGWDVSQGQLFQLPVLLPNGWEVEKVEMAPAPLLHGWHVRKAAGKATLFVDLARPLGARTSSENEHAGETAPRTSLFSPAHAGGARLPALTVQLRPAGPDPIGEKRLPFPDVAPLGARFREGALALDCDEQLFHLQVQTSAERTQPESEGPWGQKFPEYYYRYYGQSIRGEILVHPRPPRLRAKCESEVLAAGGEAIVETRLILEAEAGSPNTIELLLSAGDGGTWQWRSEAPRSEETATNRVRRAERVYSNETSCGLHLLAASHPLQAAVVMAARPTSERWRLTLARPLRPREPLRLHARRRLLPHENRWDVPLPVVVGAERMAGEVVLHLADAGLALVHSVGLRESASTADKGITPWRTFHYGLGEVSLTLSGAARVAGRSSVAAIEKARLITYAGESGVLRHHFSFQVANWGEHTLPLRLPLGARPLAVQIDGRWLPRIVPSSQVPPKDEKSGPVELALPVPKRAHLASGDKYHLFEIVYTNASPAAMLWQSLDAPAPQLPIAPVAFRRIWRLAPKLIPLHQERYQFQAGAAGTVESAALPRHLVDFFHLPGSLAHFDPLAEQQQADVRPRQLDFEHVGGDWHEWEPNAGVTDERLIVVRRAGVTALGLALAIMLALLFALPRRRSVRRRLTLLLLALALTGLGVLWLPAALRDLAWWPFLASGAVAALVHWRAVAGKPGSPQSTPRQPQNAVSVAAVAGMLVLSVLGWNGRAAAPAPATVYLVPASADAPDKPTALVPADLLGRLKKLAQPVPLAPGGPQSVLLDASYEGQLVEEGKQAEFAAVFSAHSLSDGPSRLIVPLAGIQLVDEVLLDGARVAPLAAPQDGYSLLVRGRGRHKIEMRFRVPVIGTGDDRNVLFTAPPLLRSRLSWRVPDGAIEPQVLVKNGAQWTTHDNGRHLQADLGALPLPVHLHWYQPSRPTSASYQAAYLWDLGLEVSHLTAYLRYRVEQGAIKTLEVDLPSELEVSTANAQRAPSLSRPSWKSRFQLRDWHITRSGAKRVLHLELPYPISGDFQVTLELLPRTPLASPAALPLPWPRGIRANGPHYLAYRTQPGLNAQRDTSQNLTRIDNKEFAPDWLGGPSLETNFQGIAYRIPPDRIPQLFLRLQQTPPMVQGDVDVAVRVDSQRAEIDVVAEVTAPNKDLAAIEWELPPPCVLVTATGEDVRTWKQSGSRLLVWLNHTTTRTRIRLSGWLPLSRRDGHSHLELNGPRLLQAGKLHTRLHLAASGDLVLATVQTRNLQPTKPAIRTKAAASDFETWDSSYHLDCQVQAAANAVARVLTLAEVSDRELRFTTTVDYTVTYGELRQVRLRLHNWEEEKVEVQAEREALLPGMRWIMGGRSWQLPLQAGVRGRYQVTLRGSMPVDKAAGGVPMPEVLVQGVERAEYFVAVAGGELTGKATGSLQSLKWEAGKPPADPAIADLVKRGGQVWRVSGSEWQVRLLPQARELQPAPAQLYLLEQWAAVGDGRRWMHEARCWLHHEAHANLTLDFAAPIRVLGASADGVEATPQSAIRNPQSQSDSGISDFGLRISDFNKKVWLHLPGQPGVRCIHMRWMYDPPEPLDRPNLTPPQLAGVVQGPMLWTVMVPPGWQASLAGASGWQGSAREAELAFWRADAQLRISQDLAKERRDSSVAAALPDFGFWMSDFEGEGGLPLSWEALPDGGPSTLLLTSHQRQQTRQALIASGQWLGILAAAWILSILPFLRTHLHLFWPEQIALLGVIGWHLAGLTSIVLGLLLLAVCSRIILLIRGLRALIHKRRKQPSTMTAGNGVAS